MLLYNRMIMFHVVWESGDLPFYKRMDNYMLILFSHDFNPARMSYMKFLAMI